VKSKTSGRDDCLACLPSTYIRSDVQKRPVADEMVQHNHKNVKKNLTVCLGDVHFIQKKHDAWK
jgi:hypothetical protein